MLCVPGVKYESSQFDYKAFGGLLPLPLGAVSLYVFSIL